MAQKSNLRSEIQALKNQAKAKGVTYTESGLTYSDIANEGNATQGLRTNQTLYGYVYRDILHTFLFVLLALLLLAIVSARFSTFPLFDGIRTLLHIKAYIL